MLRTEHPYLNWCLQQCCNTMRSLTFNKATLFQLVI
jgi:hypothetical protein